MNFSKAFDVVHHSSLILKNDYYGIRGTTNRWIEAFLSNRTQQVVVDGAFSSQAPVVSGVPQGSVLGPLLFLLYINDLPMGVESRLRLFADDCVVYRDVKTDADSAILQDDLDRLARWEQKWRMAFNISKCHIMHITRNKKVNKHPYQLNNQPLSTVNQTTYLGVELTSDLNWSPHIDKICSKASQSLGFLRRNLHSARQETKSAAFKSLVRPTTEYSAAVWDPYRKKDQQKLEAVQRQAARFVTKNYEKHPGTVSKILAKLNWDSLEIRRLTYRLILFYKIVYGHVDIPPSQYLVPRTRYTRHSHHLAFQKPTTHADYQKYSFFIRTITDWNSLPSHVVSADSISGFKSGLATLMAPP